MYIKDSSFYDCVRDTSSASLFLLRPSYSQIYFHFNGAFPVTVNAEKGDAGGIAFWTVNGGEFERDQPLIVENENQVDGLSMHIWGVVDFGEEELPLYASGDRTLAAMIVYATDENGELLTAVDTGAEVSEDRRVVFIKIDVSKTGSFAADISIPFVNGTVIESLNICEYLEVYSADIEKIAIKEKNDIILSSLPFCDLELSLFDDGEEYARFISRANRKLRSFLYFRYNEIYSRPFLHFYDVDPSVDRNARPVKTAVKLINILSAMNKEIYHNNSGGQADLGTDGFEKYIGEEVNGAMPYLPLIVTTFNRGGFYDPSAGELLQEPQSTFGGKIAKLHTYNNDASVVRIVSSGGTSSLSSSMVEHMTQTAADGYTYADALRLLINAQCHGMRVKNETIIGDLVENLISESGVTLSEQEYYAVPTFSKYGNIDVVKFQTERSVIDEEETSLSLPIDLATDGTVEYMPSISAQVRWKQFFLEESISLSEQSIISPSTYTGSFYVTNKGSIVSVAWTVTDNCVGSAAVILKYKSFKNTQKEPFAATFSSGSETLEVSNPFLRPRMANAVTDIPDHYAKFNLEQQANKTIYELDARGRFDVHPLDRIVFHTEKCELHSGIVIEHNFTFNGAMKSSFRVIDEGAADALCCGKDVLCSETLICR